ncbi:MAG: hypothetical protein A2087_00810 [Spirochaetes bacterium GWD1_61_31]|nr:MAG: hypothetical protein A2Y37_03235 [Spirochaetes bacterium GWB1_60_80]OHD29626.1 MAG: hypothetical protein A2004_01775 [Spirochaetes bacterium GWC1_61_12]OHD37529.1 MAG: hypothetical protein A2087_00810 [Spirochaetes bacterium GWD1_61_31]OHD41961.1 MAG: hypothetical protein A2Y35_14455 [Spirochaetes bacterium GWE1_60_18]OHD61773.1 MAG: hypothetical protein A2Y32_13495 [Spirochaetes bacterium GWF1_60_12]
MSDAQNNSDKAANAKTPEQLIGEHVGLAMIAGAIPIPFVDLAVVTTIQVELLNRLAQHYQVDFNLERGKSMISSLIASSAGIMAGKIGASLVKGIPGIGSLLGVGSQVIFSGASTYAIGHIFDDHFRKQGSLFSFDFERVKRDFQAFFEEGTIFAQKKQKQPPTGQSKDDILSTIAKLNNLMQSGAINKDEFEKAKADLLTRL